MNIKYKYDITDYKCDEYNKDAEKNLHKLFKGSVVNFKEERKVKFFEVTNENSKILINKSVTRITSTLPIVNEDIIKKYLKNSFRNVSFQEIKYKIVCTIIFEDDFDIGVLNELLELNKLFDTFSYLLQFEYLIISKIENEMKGFTVNIRSRMSDTPTKTKIIVVIEPIESCGDGEFTEYHKETTQFIDGEDFQKVKDKITKVITKKDEEDNE